jgi:hypothetical protein
MNCLFDQHSHRLTEAIGRPLGNENGTAIVAALLILLLLTIVALTATDTTVNEKAMVRSEAIFEQNFSLAESASLEGVQKLDNKGNDQVDELLVAEITVASDNYALLLESDSAATQEILALLDTNNDGVIDSNDTLEVSELNAETFRAAVLLPIDSGDSISVTAASSRLYTYNSFGISEHRNGKVMVRVGYKRRIDH